MESTRLPKQIGAIPLIASKDNLTSEVRNLNLEFEKIDSQDNKFISKVDNIVELVQQHLFEISTEDLGKELKILGKNISNKLQSEKGKSLVEKINKEILLHKYFESVQVDKNLRADLKSQREKIFWGLGDDWWKQIIDKPQHKFGPEVFDRGLHKGRVEPGYLNGIKEASSFATQFIGKENSVALYKEIHKHACQHFDSDRSKGVLVSSEKVGQFSRLEDGIKTEFKFKTFDPDYTYLYFYNLYSDPRFKIDVDFIEKMYPGKSLDFNNVEKRKENALRLEESKDKWEKRILVVNSEISKISEEIGLNKPYATLTIYAEGEILVSYRHLSQEELEKSVEALFDQFNKKALVLQNDLKKKLENSNSEDIMQVQKQYETDIRHCIAKLFQALEWLHPFPDGQGRTDLILLAKLLTDYGLHPVILEQPYASSIFPFEEWDSQLVTGLDNWANENKKD